MRGGGAEGRGGGVGATGGRTTGGTAGCTDSATGGGEAGCITCGVGGTGGRTGTGGGAGGAATGTFATGAAGRGTAVGTTGRGGAGGAIGDLATGAAATGATSTGGWATGGRTGTGGACCLRMALRTSPGREICERSIFVLISSLPIRLERAVLLAAEDSPAAVRKCPRTFSASWSSSELECVFFSVTPTTGSTSRIALLLTSSSLARSLIRILLILLFAPPTLFR